MKVFGKMVLGVAVLLASGQFANAELLMLLEGDVESGGVALDSSVNGNHGIYLGSASGTDDGRTGGALNFNADDSYLVTNQIPVGNSAIAAASQTTAAAFAGIQSSQEYSIGFWMAGGDTNPRNSSTFWADGVTPNGGNRAIQAHVTWGNGTVFLDQGGCCDGDTQRLSGPLDEEQIRADVGEEWSHFTFTAGVEDDIAFRRIYVNGDIFLEAEASLDNAEIPIIDNFFWGSDNNAGNQWEGRLDDVFVADEQLSEDDVLNVFETSAREFFQVEGTPEPVSAQFLVFNNEIGTETLAGEVSNVVLGEPALTQGLTNFWYDANLRANPEGFLEAGDTGSEAAPLVAEPFASPNTWWRGGQANPVSTVELENYPQAGLAGTRFEGSENSDQYSVRLTGEIFIPEDGDYLIRDGIDDYTMIAIDLEGDGELDGVDELIALDVGAGGFDDVLVHDDDWANADGSSQPVDFHGFAEIENVGPEGDWRRIEIWMSEGGGGDAGIVYMANLDDPDIFDDLSEEALTEEQRDAFLIPPENLRSVVASIESADAAASLDEFEYVIQVGPDGNDAIAVGDNGGIFNTSLDVAGATITVELEGDVAEGTTFQILDADNILNAGDLTLNLPAGFSADLEAGTITFGAGIVCDPNTGGDIDGDGSVGFSDFLILSSNFGTDVASHEQGDLDCGGSVEFADFLVLSNAFGTTVGAEASSVPEPSGIALLSLAGLALGFFRRRR